MATEYSIEMAQTRAEQTILQWAPRRADAQGEANPKVFRETSSTVISFRKARRRRRGTSRFILEVVTVCCLAVAINALIVLVYSGAL
jgi:hypothetical protein